MNIINILEEIEKVDNDLYERLSPRRKAMKSLLGKGARVAVSAVPLALASMFKKAYGQSNATVIDVLNFALKQEYLESEFYTRALALPTLIPAAERASFTTIRDNETTHVADLQETIRALGGTPIPKPAFDYTAKGNFLDVFLNFDTFLTVAQTFEDTGVRAYKGQAPLLMSNGDVLTAALKIHSVEGRHVAHIRSVRMNRGVAIKPWITLNQSGSTNAAVNLAYAGEENTKQASVEITNINGMQVSATAASEAFDEPLTREQVTAIVAPFMA